MFSLIWGAANIVFVVVLLLLFLVAKIDVVDIMYTILSGSVVGMVMCVFALSQGISTGQSAFLVFSGGIGAVVSWFFAGFLLQVTTVSLYGNTAIAFDIFVGLVGATSLCLFCLGIFKVKSAK
jgi:hypothetical protein